MRGREYKYGRAGVGVGTSSDAPVPRGREGRPPRKLRTGLRGLPAGGSAFLPAFNAHFSPELHPARPLRTPAWGLWAGWARAESAAGTRGRGWATGSERSFVPGCPASGGPVAQESPSGRSCGREEKLLYFQPMASVCSSLTAIACRGLCADISWGRVLVDANAQISREISE